jgi:hypothetical protein
VLGNPPWELVELREPEYFAASHPEIARARTAAARKRLIGDLEHTEPWSWNAYQLQRRTLEGVVHFARASKRYPDTARGRINTYALFADLMCQLQRIDGSVGVVVKSGLVGDFTYASFLRDKIKHRSLASVLDFDNRDKIFAAVQGNVRFSLVTFRVGSPEVRIAARLRSMGDLTQPDRTYELTSDDLAQINPDTGSIPLVASKRDAELVARLHRGKTRLAPCGAHPSRAWCGDPKTMTNMATASARFRDREALIELGAAPDQGDYLLDGRRLVRVYESKFISQYDHRTATFDGVPRESRFGVHAGARRSLPGERTDINYTVTPRYWIDEAELEGTQVGRRGWVLAFRDAISATADARSCIAAIVPRVTCGHTLLVVDIDDARDAALFLAAMNSFVFDYLVKQKISGGHLVIPALRQIALPAMERFNTTLIGGESPAAFLAERAIKLTYRSDDLSGFGHAAHVDSPFRLPPEEEVRLRTEIDAAFLMLYEATRAEAEHMLDSFEIVCRRELAAHGEFRSRRLILEAYDRFLGGAPRPEGVAA